MAFHGGHMKGSLSRLPVWIISAAAVILLALLMMQTEDGGTASQQEKRIAEVLSAMAGAGRVEVALYYAQQDTAAFSVSSAGDPTGALVVAEGAGDMAVRLNLIRAVRTLLGLPENAVDVFVMEGKP